MSLIEEVLRAEQRECGYGTWQDLDEEQIAAEAAAWQTAVQYVLDIVASEQMIRDLQAHQNAVHDTALQEQTRVEIEAETAAVEEHFNMLRQTIQQLLLLQVSAVSRCRAPGADRSGGCRTSSGGCRISRSEGGVFLRAGVHVRE